jgi:hypothetical protein
VDIKDGWTVTDGKTERDMTRSEINAATNNDAVDWGWIDLGPRHHALTLWRRLSLWTRIVGRTNQADYRSGPFLSCRICAGIWPWGENVKAWGVVSDRR